MFNPDGTYKGTRSRKLRPGELEQMTAQIVQIRDYQSKRAIERAHKELEKEAAAILVPFVETTGFTETVPYGGAGIDGMTFNGDETGG